MVLQGYTSVSIKFCEVKQVLAAATLKMHINEVNKNQPQYCIIPCGKPSAGNLVVEFTTLLRAGFVCKVAPSKHQL